MQTWGSEGDIRPFFALGEALARRGHEVRLLYTNVDGRDLSSLGGSFRADDLCGAYFRDHRAQITARARENFRIRSPIRQLDRILEDALDPVAEEMLDAGRQLCASSDLVVTHFLAHPAVTAAEAESRPYACLAFSPVYPTRHHPPMGAPRLGPLLNPALWWVAGRAMSSVLAARVNRLRERAKLPSVRDVSGEVVARARLSLLAMSPALLARPDDWDARIQLCGVITLREAPHADAPLDASLRSFLEAGPPPAFFSLGSMANLEDERAAASVQAMVSATANVGIRAVVQAPPPVLAAAPRADHVHYVARAPHALLFPRCSLVVHHGGAGTTHAALRAGRPSVIVPHIGDQFYWADLLCRRGVAAPPLPAPSLDAPRLEKRLRAVLATPEMTTRAEALGRALAEEDGAELACDLLEKCVGSGSAS